MKIFIGISGASGVFLGIYLAKQAVKYAQVYMSISKSAKEIIKYEIQKNNVKNTLSLELKELKALGINLYEDSNMAAPPSSGSFGIDATIIAPCSINTLAKINSGYTDTLITRAAAVALKERKKLILGIREMPLSSIVLRQCTTLSELGAIIAPPIIADYSQSNIYDFLVGKWLDAAGVEHKTYKRWSE